MLGAEVLPQIHQMIQVFRDGGFPVTTRAVPGVRVRVEAANPPPPLSARRR